MRQLLRHLLNENAYPGYVYGYPHKKAYRALPGPRPLAEVWEREPRDRLFCYVHVPFCNQRCSFCNLFTFVPADESPAGVYLDALAREMEAYRAALGEFRFARLYVGGGTPTYLTGDELRRLVRDLRDVLGVDPAAAHGCVEASPETLDEDKVGVLRDLGFRRVSLGVQSFVPEELEHVNRRFDFRMHERAIGWVGRAGFAHFNIDLIYGLPGQTEQSWLVSLEQAVASPATSLFLYPLYVRPLTGLDRRADTTVAPTPRQMGRFYDLALERLAGAGFRQITMRQFLRDGPRSAACGLAGEVNKPFPHQPEAPARGSPSLALRAGEEGLETAELEYRCQHDGMVGLGAGARSYTRALHYSTPWRMVARNIRGVVEDYCVHMREGRTEVFHGFELNADEQRRRFAILSLLYDGLDFVAFALTFGEDARRLFADEWEALLEEDCVTLDGAARLTRRGVRHADVVGQLFFSERVRQLLNEYEYDR